MDIDLIDHRPIRRPNRNMVALVHRHERVQPRRVVGVAVVDLLEDRLIVQFARRVVRQRDRIKQRHVAVEILAGRIEGDGADRRS